MSPEQFRELQAKVDWLCRTVGLIAEGIDGDSSFAPGPPYTVPEAAEVSGLTLSYLRRHAKELGGVKRDRWRFDRATFHAAIGANTKQEDQ